SWTSWVRVPSPAPWKWLLFMKLQAPLDQRSPGAFFLGTVVGTVGGVFLHVARGYRSFAGTEVEGRSRTDAGGRGLSRATGRERASVVRGSLCPAPLLVR